MEAKKALLAGSASRLQQEPNRPLHNAQHATGLGGQLEEQTSVAAGARQGIVTSKPASTAKAGVAMHSLQRGPYWERVRPLLLGTSAGAHIYQVAWTQHRAFRWAVPYLPRIFQG